MSATVTSPSTSDALIYGLLNWLSPEALSLLGKHFRTRDLEPGFVLWEPGSPVDEVFFPISGFISIRVPTEEGRGVEIASVGREGGVGFEEGIDTFSITTVAVLQTSGQLVSVSAKVFAVAAQASDEISRVVELCKAWLLSQAQILAACNAVHPADARFCRWLLRASDALGSDHVSATQETIAQCLGVRRTTATLIAQGVQSRGLISYVRGKIVIHDRAQLKAAACDCYRKLRHNWPSDLLCTRKHRAA